MFKRKEENPDSFWQEFEEKTGQKVLARSIGQYIYGWEDFDDRGWKDIWGLLIATSGGFHFHHFPQYSWIDSMVSLTGRGSGPKEKTFFIPNEKIISAQLNIEKSWWKNIIRITPPKLIINYRDEAGNECKVLLEAEFKSDDLAEALNR